MKRFYQSALVVALVLAFVPDASAQRWRFPRVCSGGSCARYSTSYRATGYAAGYTTAPSPCEAIQYGATCEPVQTTPAPCEPVLSSPVGSTYSAPEPCAPVETCGEYAPIATEGGVIVKYSPACPTGSCPLTSAVKSTRNVVSSLLAACNGARARYGVASLERDAELERGALAQARYCATVGSLVHGSGVAEILAYNSADGANAISQWLNSPAHRALLLSRGYTKAGAAAYTDVRGVTWYAVRFR